MRPSKNLLLCFSLILCSAFSNQAQIVINEYSASNLTKYLDNFGKAEDWFELYNPTTGLINLNGYYLSDDSAKATKWKITSSINIAAGGFVRFWASGRNLIVGSYYHTNFKLTQTKSPAENIVLSNPSGTIIDGVSLRVTQLGHSYGRTTNGASTWSIFTKPTPNASNNTSTPYADYASRPDASISAGFYHGIQTVTLTTTEPNSVIYYSTDGYLPDSLAQYNFHNVQLYSGPISIPATTVLKAITFSSNPTVLPSLVRYETYFIDETITLPVVSISGTYLDTLASGITDTGSVSNNANIFPYGSLEYFDSLGVRTAKTYGQFDRHGQDSWANDQRSIDFTSRDEMGYNYALKERLFKISTRDKFQRVILRAAGDDNYPANHNTANANSAHLRDAYVQMLAKRGGMDLDVRIAEKVIVFLNGIYWGVYDIRERCDDHDYTNYYYGQDKYHIQYLLTWGSTWAAYGGNQAIIDWNSLYNYIMANNMADTSKFNYVISQYDAKSLVDYVITNSFTVCSDWLNYNTGWWRGLDSTGTHKRWGYILWDNDAVFDFYINYTGIPNTAYNALPCDAQGLNATSDPEGHIQVLNRLRMNPAFEQYYVSRMIDLWNTVFTCDNMITQLDEWTAKINPEMPRHALRWNGTYAEWQTNVQTLRNYILQRCNALSTGFITCYNLNGPYNITVNADPPGTGNVNLNTLSLTQFPWHGTYFGGMDNLLQAVPVGGHSFTTWSAVSNTLNPNNTSINTKVDFTNSDSIVAHFSATSAVNEINANDPSINVYPTLFSNFTKIDYSLAKDEKVSISLHSLLGDKVAVISDNLKMQKGFYSVELNLSSTSLPAGVYLLHFTFGNSSKTVKLIYQPD